MKRAAFGAAPIAASFGEHRARASNRDEIRLCDIRVTLSATNVALNSLREPLLSFWEHAHGFRIARLPSKRKDGSVDGAGTSPRRSRAAQRRAALGHFARPMGRRINMPSAEET